MSIDEAIARERQEAKEQRSHIGIWNKEYSKKCEEYAEEHEQLAEWLEELKFLRQWKSDVMDEFCKYDCNSVEEVRHNAYSKAIDDFAEKLNAKCDGIIKIKWNSTVAPISWAEAYADFKDDIDEIAEQLKAGVGNGT